MSVFATRSALGYVVGADAMAIKTATTNGSLVDHMCKFFARRQVAAGLGDAWPRLPLAARLTVRAAAGQKLQPFQCVIGSVANGADQWIGPFMFLDEVRWSRREPADDGHSNWRLTLVLYDWTTLTLDTAALRTLGCPIQQLVECLLDGARAQANASSSPRWLVDQSDGTLHIRIGDLADNVQPRVGRFALGTLGWQRRPSAKTHNQDTLPVALEVIVRPRLTAPSVCRTNDVVVNLGGDTEALEGWLKHTVWQRGSAASLLAMLRLASGQVDIVRLGERVVTTATDDPSPLAWLPLLDALEAAVEAQRRAYVRHRRIARAPVGTLRVNAYINNLARGRGDRVPVDRFELSYDTPENRLFKGVASVVRRLLARRSDALATELRRRFEHIEATFERTTDVEPTVGLVATVELGLLPEVQARAVALCRAALTGRYPGLELIGETFGKITSFELNLAELFEAAARAVLDRCTRRIGLHAHDGNTMDELDSALVWHDAGEGDGRHRSRRCVVLKPDFVVCRGRAVVAVGDAKYKRVAIRPPENASHAPLRREDLHQLAAYLLAWPKARWGVVMLPWVGDASRDGRATRHVSTLTIAGQRPVGVFLLDAERWRDDRVEREPLARWVCKRGVADRATHVGSVA